jgi:peptidoglycan/LPS O-acetylase OafA/YrhL
MQKRIHYLDSARGLAALSVVIYHCIGGYGQQQLFGKTEEHIALAIINGGDAVSFFFVLSGFVLSYRYFTTDTIPDYPKYIISRLFRLYPAFWFMIIVFSIYANNGFRGFSNDHWNYIKEASLYQNFAPMLGQAWSLNIELPLSLMLPVFIIAAQREIRYMYFALPMMLIFHAFIAPFFFHFILGIIVSYWFAKQPDYLERIYNTIKKYAFLAIPAIWIMFSLRHIWQIIFKTPLTGFDWFWAYTGIEFFAISAVASFFILIIILQSERLQRLLNWRGFLFLGKISYSLYICHWFVLYTVVCAKHDFLKNMLHIGDKPVMVIVFMLTIIISFLLSTFMYYTIEKPAIKWGKQVATRL